MLHHRLIKAIKGSEQKKGQGPSEMIGSIISGDSPNSDEFTRAGIIAISDCMMMGESFVLSPCIVSYKSPGPLDMSLSSSSG